MKKTVTILLTVAMLLTLFSGYAATAAENNGKGAQLRKPEQEETDPPGADSPGTQDPVEPGAETPEDPDAEGSDSGEQTSSEDPVDPEYNPFEDLQEGAYYVDAVLWAIYNEITNGTGAATFSPNVSCTRAQVVTFLWRANGSPEPETTECSFTDVDQAAYYYEAMLWAIEKGITNGISETAFGPNQTCTRGQVVTFLYRAAGAPEVESRKPYRDVDAENYFCAPVIWAVEQGITTGTSAVAFTPNSGCTRAQVVTFLYRVEHPVEATQSCKHNYIAGEKKDATCTETGGIAYRCENCGDAYVAAVPALGHSYEDTVIRPRTDRGGYTEHTCTVCGYSYKDSYTDKVPIRPVTEEDMIWFCTEANNMLRDKGILLEGVTMNANLWWDDPANFHHPEGAFAFMGSDWVRTNDSEHFDYLLEKYQNEAFDIVEYNITSSGWGSKIAFGYYYDTLSYDFPTYQIVIYDGD